MATTKSGLWWLVVCCCRLFSIQANQVKSNVTETIIVIGDSSMTLSFNPSELEKLVMGKYETVYVSHQVDNLDKPDTGVEPKRTNENSVISLKAQCADKSIATINNNNIINLPLDSDYGSSLNESSFTVQGEFLGRTHLNIYAKVKEGMLVTYKRGEETLNDAADPWAPPIGNYTGVLNTQRYLDIPTTGQQYLADDWQKLNIRYKVAVIREDRALDKVFLGTVIILLVFANVGMGCKIDLEVVKEVLRRPVAPAIGFCCQFLVMPLVRF